MPLLTPELRAAVDLALVDRVWKSYVRDAGPGDVGPLFSGWKHPDHVLLSEDPRAGAVLSWVSSREGPLRHGANLLHEARGRSGTRFSAADKDMLAESLAVLSRHGVMLNAAPPVENLMAAVKALRNDARFLSDNPGGGGYLGGAWAINLALATISTPAPQPGIVTRELLKSTPIQTGRFCFVHGPPRLMGPTKPSSRSPNACVGLPNRWTHFLATRALAKSLERLPRSMACGDSMLNAGGIFLMQARR